MQGPAGPKGGGLYTTRDDVYCNKVVGIADASATLRASCNTATDLPLSGSCFSANDQVAVVLDSEPGGWAGAASTQAAQWFCQFGKNGVLINTPFAGAVATICCVIRP